MCCAIFREHAAKSYSKTAIFYVDILFRFTSSVVPWELVLVLDKVVYFHTIFVYV
jgi:hypothetical protein